MELPAPPLLDQNRQQACEHAGWAAEPERKEGWETIEKGVVKIRSLGWAKEGM
jgi:hypothetical protein